MSGREEARRLGRIAAGAGVAGVVGAIGAGAGAGFVVLLKRQAAQARALIGKPLGEVAPHADKVYKKSYGDPVELLILGDSIAAGLGAEDGDGTLGARLAKGIAKKAHRSVRLTTAAIVGSESWQLPEQLASQLPDYRPDVAVVIVGGNDVTHRVPVADSVKHLTETIEALHALDASVVVGTCPDLSALKPVPQPLRSLGGRASRQLAAAQADAAHKAGAYVVSLADVVGPFFVTNPDEMFSLDRFHPSAVGYKRTAKALLPSILAALGIRDDLPFGHQAPVFADAAEEVVVAATRRTVLRVRGSLPSRTP
ncbi:SGNH/GDSL hydrolase family protein [Nocardioides nematodiphilus]|uniref:SGNH/GDSL hydrolase family protein n=1 Tax=Nocardioides nematodiphilus TaxID=2849669 RepID=UPI001CDA08C8|nr:SGNH/GDSL hydrolase family protein [Nocardioides nematodiphilus]MCA1981432.1 SGNH/GDSL hydrolase family protein [Nocardioides nematodiphilus]